MGLKEQYMLMPYDLSGSRSKNRFRIELLWGIDKMLELMESDKSFTMVFDYVCDIEVHMQDELEFYQIKTHSKSQGAYTTKSLTKVDGKHSQGSILGKLYVLNEKSGRNNLIAIVSNSPYKMPGNNFVVKLMTYVAFILLVAGVVFTLFGDFTMDYITGNIPLLVGVAISFILEEIFVARIKRK